MVEPTEAVLEVGRRIATAAYDFYQANKKPPSGVRMPWNDYKTICPDGCTHKLIKVNPGPDAPAFTIIGIPDACVNELVMYTRKSANGGS